MSDEDMCYAARFPGKPGYGAVTVDMPERRNETARDVAKWMRQGATIDRVTVEQARIGLKEYIDAKKIAKGRK